MSGHINLRHASVGLLSCVWLSAVACTQSDDAQSGRTAAKVAAPAVTPQVTPKACELISAVEMATILGAPVEPHSGDGESFGQTSCTWTPVTGYSPYAELKIEWGSGEAAMFATGILSGIEPGLTSPFDGLGDQASAVGPTVMIQRGEDLVTIVLSVNDDSVPMVREIYATIDARF
jgi:hypothetical protein